jgi:hypothetical protein
MTKAENNDINSDILQLKKVIEHTGLEFTSLAWFMFLLLTAQFILLNKILTLQYESL